MTPTIAVLDFGSQYTQLIARRIRELNVYCEIYPFHAPPSLTEDIKGVILSGGPCSVRDASHPDIDLSVFRRLPVLGICYGAQLMAHREGGRVAASQHREYGKAYLTVSDSCTTLLDKAWRRTQVWMSHADTITALPQGYETTASTSSVDIAAFHRAGSRWYGLQFHPEVTHTEEGKNILRSFVIDICGCLPSWTPARFVETKISELADKLASDRVIMALSGGVDSTVAAKLLHAAIGKRLYCVFVDNGLLRKGEFEQVLNSYKGMGLNVKGIDAKSRFYAALKGVADAEKKRKAIGRTFVEAFEEEARHISGIAWLGQGTIYPDVIESAPVQGPSAVIKSHHNVGGLPEKMNLKTIEPLNVLFKDEVRKVGAALDIDPAILGRHPFPGPGLGVRIIGEVDADKVAMLQEADHIFIEELRRSGLYKKVWQAGAVLLPIRSVGVMGDERTYENAVALRAVNSLDGMTAEWSRLPHEFFDAVSSSIINRVKGINRVVYDISSKPPATIEWE